MCQKQCFKPVYDDWLEKWTLLIVMLVHFRATVIIQSLEKLLTWERIRSFWIRLFQQGMAAVCAIF